VAEALGITDRNVLVASTGVIGQPLPVVKICDAVPDLVTGLSQGGGTDAATAIMTTDTVPKEVAARVQIGGTAVTIGGMAKGAGMIAPNMATMLAFVTTDADIRAEHLGPVLRTAVDGSFNCISVDGDSSTNDTVLLFANGAAGGPAIVPDTVEYDTFCQALNYVCGELALMIVRDGEGATRMIEVHVTGAADDRDARRVARSVGESLLVKTAVFGGDANWGRIACAIGYSDAQVDPTRVTVAIGEVEVMRNGQSARYDEQAAAAAVNRPEVPIHIELGLGSGEATLWTCDLTDGYIRINADYRS